ncbi:acyltransferase [Levilactobacillus parabrevis]|uniref:acyltransferase family protein n=1 Tax=Levilactobacillus parabrevis TaxID=357278 RepID=UPI0021A76437|nr:acyltransferase family protein [Levilactobacillus parabrevis]MCT4490109.1 acyltransferase [Levilactobacillus parabrevis]
MAKKRIHWVDMVKGYGIVLVVIGHSLAAFNRRVSTPDIHSDFIFNCIYSYHMALFFFVSGIFIHSWAHKHTNKAIKIKFKRLMFPYFIWGIILILIEGIYTHNIQLIRIVELPVRPTLILWFLYSLFIDYLIYYFIIRITKNNTLVILSFSLIIFFIGSVITHEVKFPVDTTLQVISQSLYYFIFLYLGSLVNKINYTSMFTNYLVLLSAIITFVGLNWVSMNFGFGNFYPLLKFIVTVSGIYSTVSIMYLLEKYSFVNRLFTYLGQLTMPIYLMHKIIVELVSLLAIKLTSLMWPFALITTVLSILVCIIGYNIIKNIHLEEYLFGGVESIK